MILKLWNDNAGVTVTLHAADDEILGAWTAVPDTLRQFVSGGDPDDWSGNGVDYCVDEAELVAERLAGRVIDHGRLNEVANMLTRKDDMLGTTCHADGAVTYWDVYRQQWQTEFADSIGDEILASLSDDERSRIRLHSETTHKE